MLGAPFDKSYTWSQVNKLVYSETDPATLDESYDGQVNSLIMGPGIDYNEISKMQNNLQGLTRLNNTDCAKAYNSDLVSDLRNLLLVTDTTSGMGSILNVFTHATQFSPIMPWFCGNTMTTSTSCQLKNVTNESWQMYYSTCLLRTVYEHESGAIPQVNKTNKTTTNIPYPNNQIQAKSNVSSAYKITNTGDCYSADFGLSYSLNSTNNIIKPYGYTFPIPDAMPSVAHVQYCLAQKAEERCEVSFNSLVLSIVILCNVLKTVSLVVLLYLPNFTPIGRYISFPPR